MDKHILPSIHGARLSVNMRIDEISEAFETGGLSRTLVPYEPTFFEKIFGYHTSMIVDETDVKRSFVGIGQVRASPEWKDAPALGLWPRDQKLVISVEEKVDVWLDERFRPMLGYVDGLETEYRIPDSPVFVNLELPAVVADKLFKAVDDASTRPNTELNLVMEWIFTQSYKTHDGRGSGAALWYPWSVMFYRNTKTISR